MKKYNIKGVARRNVVKVVKVMGIKGLPEQLKHYHRDSRVEQFRGALASFFILCFLPLFARRKECDFFASILCVV